MSNAPCLHKYDNGKKCWKSVSPKGSYCEEHQKKSWVKNGYTPDLPPNWESLKRQVISRDKGICYRCGNPGADSADHKKARALGGTDSLLNLRAIHDSVPPYCHREKTAEDAKEGKRLNSNAPRTPILMGDVRLNDF